MIVKCFLTFALLAFNMDCISQKDFHQKFNAQVIYELTFMPDSNNRRDKKTQYMELLVNDSVSLFRSVNLGIIDSVNYEQYNKGNKTASMLLVMQYPPSFFYTIIKTRDDIYYNEFIGSTGFIYKEPKGVLQWTLQNDSASIGGFSCQKAITNFGGRSWVAWFSKDIAVADGPYKFCGLPGLIVEIFDEGKNWNFLLEAITNKSTSVALNYNKNYKYEEIKKENFIESKRYYSENKFELMNAKGSFKGVSEERKLKTQKSMRERFTKDNNWIELYKK